jgi:hypothetical protein
MSDTGKTQPQIAYEAYAAHQEWKNYAGQPIPPWDSVREDIKAAWAAAMSAVLATMFPPY